MSQDKLTNNSIAENKKSMSSNGRTAHSFLHLRCMNNPIIDSNANIGSSFNKLNIDILYGLKKTIKITMKIPAINL